MMKKIFCVATVLLLLIFMGLGTSMWAQGNRASFNATQVNPIIFQLGEQDKIYEEMVAGHSTLLDACGQDMNLAYTKLMGMMQEMEAYATLVGFDIKGVSAWMHFFWRQDGSIDHIGFHLKPNSKNIDPAMFKAFLEGFTKQFKLPLKHSKKYAHYSSFSFPIVKHSTNSYSSKSTAKAN